MNKNAMNKLHLTPRSDEQLQAALANFDLKWQKKASRLISDERIALF